MRHQFLEWIRKNKRATFGSTFRPFQSVELSLHWLLPSRANVRFTQHNEFNKKLNSNTTDTVYRTDPLRGNTMPASLSKMIQENNHRSKRRFRIVFYF